MRLRERLSSVTIAVLLTVGLFSRLAAAPAAGRSDPDAKLSPLVLRLYGGFTRAEAGDINEGLDGYFEVLELYSALGLGTTTGAFRPLHDGRNFGADLVFQITPHVGIGIGAGYLRFSKSSSMTFTHGSGSVELSAAPVLSAVPIRLGLFLTFPLGRRLNLTINGGAEAYAALKLDAAQRINAFGDLAETSLSASRSAPSFNNLGFEGSLGFEFLVSRKVGFFIEAAGRYARLKNFAKAALSNSEGTVDGRLYLETFTYPEGTWNQFTVEKAPPASDPPFKAYKEPKIDLSGFSLQAGFRLRL